jgi:2-dehydro-3-deoxygalactonokinase
VSEQHILGDWGTTHLRLYLIEQRRVARVREAAGIGHLSAPPAEVLTSEIQAWLGRTQSIDVVLSGMASARTGLAELPYVRAPARLDEWVQGARSLGIGPLNVLLATGIQCGDDASGFDVMRGEETQFFGATQIDPALCTGSQCLVLPGTHTKWVDAAEGAIVQFRTAVTGELYGLLREHSSLLKADPRKQEGPEQFDLGFTAGSEHGMQINISLLTTLFRTRTAQLLQGRTHAWASGFLSGLLISYELATMQSTLMQTSLTTIIGEAQLASLYQRVFRARGVSARVLDGTECALRGLTLLRDQHK